MSYLMHQKPEDRLLDEIFRRRFSDYVCPCGREKVYRMSARRVYGCACGRQLSPLAGTIFNKSQTPLLKWLEAYYQVAADPKVSGKRIQSLLGVTQKTALRMRKLIKQDLYGVAR